MGWCKGEVSDETPACEGRGWVNCGLGCTKPWGWSRGSSAQGCSMQLRSLLQLMLTCTLRAEQGSACVSAATASISPVPPRICRQLRELLPAPAPLPHVPGSCHELERTRNACSQTPWARGRLHPALPKGPAPRWSSAAFSSMHTPKGALPPTLHCVTQLHWL